VNGVILMLIKVSLSIGFPMAKIKDEIEINDKELEGKSEQEKENYINEIVDDWANNYIETSWEIEE
jgi:hypothetical protein